jgi:hypothetical protein
LALTTLTPAKNLPNHAQPTLKLNYTPSKNSTKQQKRRTNTTKEKEIQSEICNNKLKKDLKTNDKRNKKHNRGVAHERNTDEKQRR